MRTEGSRSLLSSASKTDIARLARFAREALQASAVWIHLFDGDEVFPAGDVGAWGSAASERVCADALRAVFDVRVRRSPAVGEDAMPVVADAPVRRPGGDLAGCLSVAFAKPRPVLSDLETRILRELAGVVGERIEERRRSERTSARQLAGIATSSPDGIVAANADNVIVAWNAGAERLFGYAASEAIGRSLDLIVPLPMQAAHRGGLARVAGGAAPKLLGKSVDLSARRRDGTQFPIELSLSRWMEGGEQRFGAIIRDISERKKAEDELRTAAAVDSLTGLANRSSLNRRFGALLAAGRRVTVLIVDLDGFKEINDTLGHLVGDAVLAEVARRIRATVGAHRFAARMGGDEFVVLIEDSANPMDGHWLGETLIDAIEATIPVGASLVSISASVGVACSSDTGIDIDTLLGDADLALYQAKKEGRGRTHLFTAELRRKVVEKGLARAELARAWDTRAFELYYQPQVLLRDGSFCGAEALLRWNHPTRGVLAPGAFLPMLESDTLATPLGHWILETACRQAAEWRTSFCPQFKVAVNLFSIQFKTGDIVRQVAGILERTGLAADGLELEITENTILKSDDRILGQLRRLRELGVSLAFDDFGTGYASLSMLRQFPVTDIKIDRSFVSGRDVTEKDRAITKAMVEMASGLAMTVVAEGIETSEQHALMRSQGCEKGQGYLYGRPMPAHAFQMLATGRAGGLVAAG